jgi:hypothetical protein
MKIEDETEKGETKLVDVPPGMCFSLIPGRRLFIKAGPTSYAISAIDLADGKLVFVPGHEPVITFPNATVVLKD